MSYTIGTTTIKSAIKQKLLTKEEMSALAHCRGLFNNFIHHEKPHCYISYIKLHNQFVGWCVYDRESQTMGWYVHHHHRKRGLASLLTKTLFSKVKKPSVVYVDNYSQEAERLIIKSGYNKTDHHDKWHIEHPYPETFSLRKYVRA